MDVFLCAYENFKMFEIVVMRFDTFLFSSLIMLLYPKDSLFSLRLGTRTNMKLVTVVTK